MSTVAAGPLPEPLPSASIPATDPFSGLAAHFGMLLGVSDLDVVVGHSWAKMRLHNAWLHGAGVVWGFGLEVDPPSCEVRVGPGLALEDLGHELRLPLTYCLNLRQWFAAHQEQLGTAPGEPFDAHVVARYRACLARPVPALVTPCEGAESQTAFSRITETVDLFLVPGRAPRPPDRYPRLRAFLGLPADGDPVPGVTADVETARAAVLAAAAPERAAVRLAEWRRLAALDGIDRRPSGLAGGEGSPLFPGTEPDPARPDDEETGSLLLGNLLGLRLTTTEPVSASVQAVDYTVRPAHVDTVTLGDLVPGEADAGGPRLRTGTARLDGDTVRVETTLPVLPGTLRAAVVVTGLDAGTGWSDVAVADVGFTDPEIAIRLAAVPAAGAVLRVLVAGTGSRPVVSDPAAGPVRPLAGVVGDPPTGPEGRDAVFTIGG